MPGLIEELKRRNVFRVGVAYLALAWLVIQVTDMAVPALNLPDVLNGIVFYIGLVGFPFALFFAWAFEMTPTGIKLDKEVPPEDSVAPATRHRLNQFTILVLSLTLLFVMVDQYIMEERGKSAAEDVAVAAGAVDTQLVTQTAPRELSIAVLPFRNRSAVADDAYFVDGIHDDILTLLTRVSAFDKVISRTSVERYRDTTRPIPEIAGELGVTTILEGGVQRAGDRVRINMQLIDAANDEHLWAETYDRELTVDNIFAIQSEVAKAVVAALEASLSPAETEQLEPAPPASLEAMELYFQAKQAAQRGATGDWQEANKLLEQVVELDPNFALGWAHLGQRYFQMGFQNSEHRAVYFDKAFDAVERALELNPRLGEAYLALGKLHEHNDNLVSAEEAYKQAQALIPNSPDLYYRLGELRFFQGRMEESVELFNKAIESGGDAYIGSNGRALLQLGRLDEARRIFHRAIELKPKSPDGYFGLAASYWMGGQLDQAVSWTRRAHARNKDYLLNPHLHLANAMLFWDLTDDDEAFCWANRQYAFSPEGFGQNELISLAWLIRGERDKALESATRSRQLMMPNAMLVGIRPYTLALLRDEALAQGDVEDIRALYGQMFPQLFLPEFQMSIPLLAAAIDVIPVLRKTGEEDLANRLIQASLAFIQKGPAMGAAFAADLLTMTGQYDEAIAVLQQFAAIGGLYWRVGIEFNSNLAPLHELPGYQAVIQSLRDRANAQRTQLRAVEKPGDTCRETFSFKQKPVLTGSPPARE